MEPYMIKRLFFWTLTNILIITLVSAVVTVATQYFGIQLPTGYTGIFVMCFIFGMAGSFISLQLSRWIAKRSMGVQLVEDDPSFSELVQTVHRLSRKAGIETMPEVGVYDSPDVNAFATGPSKNSSLVAVSTGLLQRMDKEERDGVLAHEIAHIQNGDMVTMALVQGVVNTFVMFAAFIVTQIISNAMKGDNDREGGGLGFFAQFMVRSLLQAVFGFLAMPVVAYFSRWREFRADAGSAELGGKQNMIKALENLKNNQELMSQVKEEGMPAFQISSKGAFMAIMSTHPPLEDRIEALRRS
jgi:heat shock protein HtpX